MNFTDFKILVSKDFPDAKYYGFDIFKAAFDKATNDAETITYEQYNVGLNSYMKNPDFKSFTQSDSSNPKNGHLSFSDFKGEAKRFWLLATDDELQAIFDEFKTSDSNDKKVDELNYEEFTKAIEKVRGKQNDY